MKNCGKLTISLIFLIIIYMFFVIIVVPLGYYMGVSGKFVRGDNRHFVSHIWEGCIWIMILLTKKTE